MSLDAAIVHAFARWQRIVMVSVAAAIAVAAGHVVLADDKTPPMGAPITQMAAKDAKKTASQAHEGLFTESKYPSATTCGTCHPRHFEEWSVSQHSYAQLSPAYMAFQNFVNSQVNGTNGDFCIRCHNQVGMNQGESPQISNLERHPTSREGITCVVCHRVENIYNKASGRIALVEGDLLQPVFGPQGDKELKRVLENTHKYRVVTKAGEPGRKIHTGVVKFTPISSSKSSRLQGPNSAWRKPSANIGPARRRPRVLPARTVIWARSRANHRVMPTARRPWLVGCRQNHAS